MIIEPGMYLNLKDGKQGKVLRIQNEYIWIEFTSKNGLYQIPYLLEQVASICENQDITT